MSGGRSRTWSPRTVVALFLLEHAGRSVTREELVRSVWSEGHHVDYERGLNYCIREVRRALDDHPIAPKYLETLPHKGMVQPHGMAGSSTANDFFRTGAQTPSHLRTALDALHRLSRAVVEPGRRSELPGALHTLWAVTATHVGLAAKSDLR